jgi:hypothetical protein
MMGEERTYKLYDFFLAAFVTVLLLSNVIAGKLISVGPLVVAGATFLFPFSYIFGDVLTEVYGYARTRRIIWFGFGANVFMVLIFMLTIAMPYPPFFKGQDAYKAVLGIVPRIVLASLIGYWIGEFVNSFIMAKLKVAMQGWDPEHKHLWMRTISSTIVGEGLDTFLFIVIAFLGVFPTKAVFAMVLWQWLIKVGVEVVFTPLTYVIVNAVKRAEGVEVYDAETYNPFKWKFERDETKPV